LHALRQRYEPLAPRIRARTARAAIGRALPAPPPRRSLRRPAWHARCFRIEVEVPMSRILVLFASHHGQTRTIAGHIAELLRARGEHVHIRDISEEQPDPGHFDAVVVGSAVQFSKHDARIGAWLARYRDTLARRPGAFFSVSMSAASTRPEVQAQLEGIVGAFLVENRFHPAVVARFAGALHYSRYNVFIRFMMRLISGSQGRPTDTRRDHVFTDWRQVERFAHDVLALVPAPALAAVG
jgi:menaquinone-dependent protoporphyrinogen oxidase